MKRDYEQRETSLQIREYEGRPDGSHEKQHEATEQKCAEAETRLNLCQFHKIDYATFATISF
ncbi:hypothetical protein CHY08_28940 (plasmid) [Rhizobium leguminosarum bv. viciae]|nr:hypothetical protein CHY08_28940 [Rhizobium leguminosarum bv. viciae]